MTTYYFVRPLTSYRGCLSANVGCSVSSGGWAVVEAWGTQGVLKKLHVDVWRELKKLEMMGLWRRNDFQMQHPFVVAAFWE